MKKINTLPAIASLFLFYSCATPDPVRVNEFDREEGMRIITVDSNQRSIFFNDGKGKLKFCSEPTPDSGESTQAGVSLGATAMNTGEKVGETDGTSSYSLGGRDSTVLITREILFRACELGLNYNATYEQQATIFLQSLDAIKKIANEEKSRKGTKANMANTIPTTLFPEAKKRAPASVPSSSDSSDSSDDE